MFLNEIHKMKTDDYDGPGSAKMVVETLIETMGLSKNELAKRCYHFVYDGV